MMLSLNDVLVIAYIAKKVMENIIPCFPKCDLWILHQKKLTTQSNFIRSLDNI